MKHVYARKNSSDLYFISEEDVLISAKSLFDSCYTGYRVRRVKEDMIIHTQTGELTAITGSYVAYIESYYEDCFMVFPPDVTFSYLNDTCEQKRTELKKASEKNKSNVLLGDIGPSGQCCDPCNL